MCYVFAGTDPALFEKKTRSVRISGVVTSICLEAKFWDILDEIAASQSMNTPHFLTTLYDEVVELRGEIGNFSSLLRVICTEYPANNAGHAASMAPMAAE